MIHRWENHRITFPWEKDGIHSRSSEPSGAYLEPTWSLPGAYHSASCGWKVESHVISAAPGTMGSGDGPGWPSITRTSLIGRFGRDTTVHKNNSCLKTSVKVSPQNSPQICVMKSHSNYSLNCALWIRPAKIYNLLQLSNENYTLQ